jgi:hypothetical protein
MIRNNSLRLEVHEMTITILVPRSVDNSHLVALIEEWVRNVFKLDGTVNVMVTEMQCMAPGRLPLETVIAITDQGGMPKQYKLHKAIPEVTFADVEALRQATSHDQVRDAGMKM